MDRTSQINIRGMVCQRCIETIKDSLMQAGFKIKSVFLGSVQFSHMLDQEHRIRLRTILHRLGFELLSDKNEQQLADIKEAIDGWIELNGHGEKPGKLSEFLTTRFNKNYDSLAEFFSGVEGMTIEKYFIRKRIEKVKELLVYTELPLSEIAFKTGFSSPHHLSAHFKKTTGQNPSSLRRVKFDKLKNSLISGE